MRCSNHPKYKGIRKPRVSCVACWRFFIEKLREDESE